VERARFCELLAPLIGANSTEQFLIGLLSLLDTMLQTPMESIVQSLPLREEAKAALLGVANPAAVPLCLIRSFESGAWGSCACAADRVGVSEETLARLYIESVQWARDTMALSR
jgi:EAL and modified HD-GYP domain-containing signal transduction protein